MDPESMKILTSLAFKNNEIKKLKKMKKIILFKKLILKVKKN